MSWWESMRCSVEQTLDQGFGTGFDAHVLAGYRFLMRYYSSVRNMNYYSRLLHDIR